MKISGCRDLHHFLPQSNSISSDRSITSMLSTYRGGRCMLVCYATHQRVGRGLAKHRRNGPLLTLFEVALMSGRRAESLGFHNPKRQRGTAFLMTRSISKECHGQGKNTAKVSPSLTLRVVIILKCATSKLTLRVVMECSLADALTLRVVMEESYADALGVMEWSLAEDGEGWQGPRCDGYRGTAIVPLRRSWGAAWGQIKVDARYITGTMKRKRFNWLVQTTPSTPMFANNIKTRDTIKSGI